MCFIHSLIHSFLEVAESVYTPFFVAAGGASELGDGEDGPEGEGMVRREELNDEARGAKTILSVYNCAQSVSVQAPCTRVQSSHNTEGRDRYYTPRL